VATARERHRNQDFERSTGACCFRVLTETLHQSCQYCATSVASADTSDTMLMARVSSFAARCLPCGKCSEFSGSYVADNVHR